ncbi:hypothetical protein LX36DRAFT_286800 [Colletotrichum falcatum]|nr:hypothetical protein LX36DRAFT_286800 [Colletotrichum falcatum]
MLLLLLLLLLLFCPSSSVPTFFSFSLIPSLPFFHPSTFSLQDQSLGRLNVIPLPSPSLFHSLQVGISRSLRLPTSPHPYLRGPTPRRQLESLTPRLSGADPSLCHTHTHTTQKHTHTHSLSLTHSVYRLKLDETAPPEKSLDQIKKHPRASGSRVFLVCRTTLRIHIRNRR